MVSIPNGSTTAFNDIEVLNSILYFNKNNGRSIFGTTTDPNNGAKAYFHGSVNSLDTGNFGKIRNRSLSSAALIKSDVNGYETNAVAGTDYVILSALTGYVPTSRNINTTSPLSGGGDLSADRTLSISNAAADASTKGAATFNASDFNDNGSGTIALDYTNGQASNGSVPGYQTTTN